MAWKLEQYRSLPKKLLLLLVILLGISVVVLDFLEESGKLKQLVEAYHV
jgi:hypothetical protein